jgi:hypothetical protein
MAESSSSASSGIGFFGLLTIVLVVAKLWDRIDWSWWWVFAPLFVPLAIVVSLFAGVGVLAGIIAVGDAVSKRLDARAQRRNILR